MRERDKTGTIVNTYTEFELKNNTYGNINIIFPNLNANSGYSFEISYDTYRNNVSIVNDESAKKSVDPYTDSIYTPISEGIVLGNIVSNKVSDTSFKVDYIGGKNIEKIKCVSFTSKLLGTNTTISGSITGNSIFTKTANNYSLLVNNDNRFNLNFASSGTYNINLTYYTDSSCSNSSKIYSHTSVIVIN